MQHVEDWLNAPELAATAGPSEEPAGGEISPAAPREKGHSVKPAAPASAEEGDVQGGVDAASVARSTLDEGALQADNILPDERRGRSTDP